MSEFVSRFSSVEIIRFFLGGLFGVFPLALFPTLTSALGVFGAITAVILAGLLLYVMPADRFSSGFRYYSEGFNKELVGMTGLKDDGTGFVRQVYDLFFFRELPDALRYRIQFSVSVYYLYSRIAFAGLCYAVLFVALGLGLTIPATNHFLSSQLGDTPIVLALKFLFLIALESVTAYYSWKYANKTIRATTNVELAACRVYHDSLKELFDKFSSYPRQAVP